MRDLLTALSPLAVILGIVGLSATFGPARDAYVPSNPAEGAVCTTDAECEAGEFLLVGQGCGPDGVVMIAREEDEFGTTCRTIDLHWVRAAD